MLYKTFIRLTFNYCPLIWIFYGKTANNRIHQLHKCTLRVLQSDYTATFEELLVKSEEVTIHCSNLQKLMIEIYECTNYLSPAVLNFCHSSTHIRCFPGRKAAKCSHARVIDLFKNTILPKCRFKAYKCINYLWFRLGKCRSRSRMVYMGYDVSKRARGKYYLRTKSSEPYCYYY